MLPLVAASPFAALKWLDKSCSNAPSVISFYNDTLYEEGEGEDPFLLTAYSDYTYGTCGLNPEPLFASCCLHSLTADTAPFSSLARVEQFPKEAPISLNGVSYCHVIMASNSTEENHSEASTEENHSEENHSEHDHSEDDVDLTGTYYKSSNDCFGQIKCSNSKLFFFPEDECKGDPEVFTLNPNITWFVSSHGGNFSAKYKTFGGAETQSYTWLAEVPSSSLVGSTFSHPGDWIGSIALELSILIQFILSLYVINRWVSTGHWKYARPVLISLWWLVSLILVSVYYFTTFSSSEAVAAFSGPAFGFMNIGTLFPLIETLAFWFQIKPKISGLVKAFSYFALVIVHVVLGGYYYLQYWYDQGGQERMIALYEQWGKLYGFWIFFSFVFGLLPIYIGLSYMTAKLRRDNVSKSAIFRTVIQDGKFVGTVILYLTSLIGYIISFVMTKFFHMSLGNDYMWFGVSQLKFLFYTLLYLCLFMFIHHLKKMIKNSLTIPK
jgi:hypothetical protein